MKSGENMSRNELRRQSESVLAKVPEEHRNRGAAAGLGATIGGVVGSMLGGPVGAAVGASIGGALGVAIGEGAHGSGGH